MLIPYSTKVYLNTDKVSKDGKCPIYIRIICNRKKTELSTNIHVFEKQWDASRLLVKKEPAMNQEISNILSEVNSWMKVMTESGSSIDLSQVRKLVKGKSKVITTLSDYLKQYLATLEPNPTIKPASKVQYKSTLSYLNQFIEQTNYINLPINDVSQKVLMDFDLFLKSVTLPSGKQFEINTVQKHHSRFRTILIKAQKENLLDKNPYTYFKLKKVKSKRTFLTQDELDAIVALDLSDNLSLDRVRDLFIFSVYTGLRFEDAQSLHQKNLIKKLNGNFELSVDQKKTGESVKIPVLKPAQEIIDKYATVMEIEGKGRVLPKLTNQKTNVYLKVIADLAGIEKTLTHHVARHTCATTILLGNEIPIEAVSGWLGHTNIKTTQIYAKITEEYLSKMAEKVTEKLKFK